MKKTLFSALLLGAAVFAASPSEARPDGWHHPHVAIRAHAPIRAHARFAFHHDFRHFSPVEHSRWAGGRWHHRWWHGHYGWWWGVGGSFYFYPAPVYPYPSEVSGTSYDDDSDYDDSGDQGGGGYDNAGPGDQGGGYGTWYHCSNPDGYYPYIKNCRSGWESVPAQPNDMQGGPQGGPGPDDNGPPPGGQYDDQAPPPPPGH